MYNTEMLYKERNRVIEFLGDYSSMVTEAKLQWLLKQLKE